METMVSNGTEGEEEQYLAEVGIPLALGRQWGLRFILE
jgi:hypothetical protein